MAATNTKDVYTLPHFVMRSNGRNHFVRACGGGGRVIAASST